MAIIFIQQYIDLNHSIISTVPRAHMLNNSVELSKVWIKVIISIISFVSSFQVLTLVLTRPLHANALCNCHTKTHDNVINWKVRSLIFSSYYFCYDRVSTHDRLMPKVQEVLLIMCQQQQTSLLLLQSIMKFSFIFTIRSCLSVGWY